MILRLIGRILYEPGWRLHQWGAEIREINVTI